jgi:hypothetical protein
LQMPVLVAQRLNLSPTNPSFSCTDLGGVERASVMQNSVFLFVQRRGHCAACTRHNCTLPAAGTSKPCLRRVPAVQAVTVKRCLHSASPIVC